MFIYKSDAYSIGGYCGVFRLLQCFIANDTVVDEEEQELKLKHPKVYRIVKMELLTEELTEERRDISVKKHCQS